MTRYLDTILDMLHGFLALDFITLDYDEPGVSLGIELLPQSCHCRWVFVHKPYFLQHPTVACCKPEVELPIAAFKTHRATLSF